MCLKYPRPLIIHSPEGKEKLAGKGWEEMMRNDFLISVTVAKDKHKQALSSLKPHHTPLRRGTS